MLKRKDVVSAILPVLMLGLFLPLSMSAQVTDVDSAFEQARQLAAGSDYEAARELAGAILEQEPGYVDVQIFFARTFAWEGNYSRARTELNKLVSDHRENADLFAALGSVEFWSGNLQLAAGHLSHSLRLDPEQTGVYLERARVFAALNQGRRAESDLKTARELEPGHEGIEAVERTLEQESRHNRIAVAGRFEHFREGLPDRSQGMIEYHRITGAGPLIVRINYAGRSSETGIQYELESYPAFGENWYAYLSAGYSDSFLFPEYRIGAELYRSLPNAFEVSGGFRYLSFRDEDVLIYTGSVGKYWRNWFFNLKPYVNFQDEGGSTAFNLTARRYFSNQYNFLSLMAGYGFATDDSRLAEGAGTTELLKSRYAGIRANRQFGNTLQVFGEIKITEQEFPFTDDFITLYTAETGLRFSF